MTAGSDQNGRPSNPLFRAACFRLVNGQSHLLSNGGQGCVELAVPKGRLPSGGVSLNLLAVTRPLAIVFYEKLLPGTQVVNRLTDLGYRVTATQTAVDVPRLVREHRPMVVIADLALRHGDFCGIISQLRASPDLAHVPVLGYCDSKNRKLVEAALGAGAKLVAAEQGIPDQLAQLLDHVLAVE